MLEAKNEGPDNCVMSTISNSAPSNAGRIVSSTAQRKKKRNKSRPTCQLHTVFSVFTVQLSNDEKKASIYSEHWHMYVGL